MASALTDRDWDNLLRRISIHKCVPFLGAGAGYGALPLGDEIAREWAERFHYPMSDTGDLVRVSQFLAVEYDLTFPKELVLERLGTGNPPDFRAADEPHAVLAALPLKVYLTTNYDDFMVKALASRSARPKARVLPVERADPGTAHPLRPGAGLRADGSQAPGLLPSRPHRPQLGGIDGRRLPDIPGGNAGPQAAA